MNYREAHSILDLPELFDEKRLKHHYYMKALKYHPDKNDDIDAKKNFQEVLEAYNYLREHSSFAKNVEDDRFEANDLGENELDLDLDLDKDSSYISILENFMNGIDKNIDVSKLLSIINNNYTEFSLKILKQFPKNVVLRLHKFVNQYSDILHINSTIVEELDKLNNVYTQNGSIIILNPTLDNLNNDDVYKLVLNNETYYIPLWHHELIYEISGNYLVVQCEPELPDYIELDQYNNMYIKLAVNIATILETGAGIPVNIGSKVYEIPVSELYIRKYQRYTIKKKGISLINTTEIYNINERANIYIDIHFTDKGASPF